VSIESERRREFNVQGVSRRGRERGREKEREEKEGREGEGRWVATDIRSLELLVRAIVELFVFLLPKPPFALHLPTMISSVLNTH
jgi:hypothetical protein